MKYHAFKSVETLDGCKFPEKELAASSSKQLREFIEVYWLNMAIPDSTWRQMLEQGEWVTFPTSGTIHIEIEE